MDELNHWLMKT